MTGTVGGGTGALYRLFAEVGGVPAERTLVNGAVRIAVERHAEVFKFVNGVGRFAAHEFDGVLVAEPVGTLDGIVHMPVPAVFRSEEHTSELQSLMRISYAVFCLKKKKKPNMKSHNHTTQRYN